MNVRSYAGLIVVLLLGVSAALAQSPARLQLAPQTGHTGGVSAVAFRPGDTQLLSASSDGTAILWDAKTGRQLRTYRGGPLSNSFLVAAELQEAKMPPTFPVAAKMTPSVSAVVFSADGRLFVMACRPEGFLTGLNANSQAVVWDVELGKRLQAFDLEMDTGAIALSPDGKQLLSGSAPMDPAEAKDMEEMGVKVQPSTGVVLWDVATGKAVRQFGEYDASFESVQFSPDGRYVLGAGHDLAATSAALDTAGTVPAPSPAPASGPPPAPAAPDTKPQSTPAPAAADTPPAGIVRLWDAGTGKQILELRPHEAVTRAAFSPSGEHVLTIGGSTLEVWNVKTSERLLKVSANAGVFSVDAKQILAIVPTGKVSVWDLAGGKEVRSIDAGFEGVKGVALSSDGKQLLVGMTHQEPPRDKAASQSPGEAVLFDLAAGRALRSFAARTDPVDFVAVGPAGRHLLVGDSLWDMTSGQKIRNLCDKPVEAFSASFSPDGKRALVANHRGSHWLGNFLGGLFGPPSGETLAALIEIPGGKELAKFESKQPVEDRVALGFSPDGKRAMTAVRKGEISVWDVASGKNLAESRIACNDLVASFSPDGKMAAVSFVEIKVLWWDREKGEKVSDKGRNQGIPTHSGAPPIATRDGKVKLKIAEDGLAVVVDDTANPKGSRTLKVDLTPYEGIRSAGFDSQDERFVFVEITSPFAGLWDVDAGKKLAEFPLDEPYSAEVMAFSPDGRRAVAAGDDGQVTFWEVPTGKRASTIKLESPILAVAFSSDGAQVAAGCADRTAVVGKATSGENKIVRGHEGVVNAVAFRPDGKMLVTASRDDGTARLWDITSGKELARIISIGNRSDWLIVAPDGKYDGSEGGRKLVAFRVGDGLDVQPAEQVSAAEYRPGLLGAIWSESGK